IVWIEDLELLRYFFHLFPRQRPDYCALAAEMRDYPAVLRSHNGNSFGLEGKIDHEPTGRVTQKELTYGRRDTERTVALLNAMKHEYDGFPLKLQPERAMRAASITKALLEKMKIEPPSPKFDLLDKVMGLCM